MTYDGRIEALINVPSGAAVSVINGAGSSKVIPVPANSYYLSALLTTLQSQLNVLSDSAAWTVTLSIGAQATGKVTINCTGTFSLTFTSVELQQLLGFTAGFAGVSAPQTGTSQARSLWIPDTPIALDGDPRKAPTYTDLRSTQSPTGRVLGLLGNRRIVHKNVRWKMVPKARVWQLDETTPNCSWETFLFDTQWALGTGALALWFTTQSPCQIYDLNGQVLGSGLATNGWQLLGVDAINAQLSQPPWTALWDIVLPSIVSRVDA